MQPLNFLSSPFLENLPKVSSQFLCCSAPADKLPAAAKNGGLFCARGRQRVCCSPNFLGHVNWLLSNSHSAGWLSLIHWTNARTRREVLPAFGQRREKVRLYARHVLGLAWRAKFEVAPRIQNARETTKKFPLCDSLPSLLFSSLLCSLKSPFDSGRARSNRI